MLQCNKAILAYQWLDILQSLDETQSVKKVYIIGCIFHNSDLCGPTLTPLMWLWFVGRLKGHVEMELQL